MVVFHPDRWYQRRRAAGWSLAFDSGLRSPLPDSRRGDLTAEVEGMVVVEPTDLVQRNEVMEWRGLVKA